MATTTTPLTVVVVGLGQMGHSHALAYHHNPGYQIIGLVSRKPDAEIRKMLPDVLQEYRLLPSFEEALSLAPDVVSINTHTATHADYAVAALEAGAHVFVEKPLAATVADAERVIRTAKRTNRKLVIGYILRHHPSWREFIRHARQDIGGPPFVMRMNLNQCSSGDAWAIHRRILDDVKNPVVDCGVHYVDVMLQITDSRPVQVRGMGIRLSEELPADAGDGSGQVNYGHLQILFEDGSLGWYEAGWGPMMSKTAYFVKDVMGPRGSVSIVMDEKDSADVNSHTKTANLRVSAVVDGRAQDRMVSMDGEPDHYELCAREQQFLLDAVRGGWDLSKHMDDAVRSLAIVLAADRSMRENRAIDIEQAVQDTD